MSLSSEVMEAKKICNLIHETDLKKQLEIPLINLEPDTTVSIVLLNL